MSFRRSRNPSASVDLEESGTSTIESSVESHVRSTVQRLLGKCERKFFHVKTFAVELWKPEFSERRDCSGTVLPHRSFSMSTVCRRAEWQLLHTVSTGYWPFQPNRNDAKA